MATRWTGRPGTIYTPEKYYPVNWKIAIIGAIILLALMGEFSSGGKEHHNTAPVRYSTTEATR